MIFSKACFKKSAFIALIFQLLMISQASLASSIKQLDINELLLNSELVFEGKVVSKKARWNANKTDILTDITFEIYEVVVGSFNQAILSLSFVGGTVEDATVTIQGSEMPNLNERGVYFVESLSLPLVNPLLGWSQGHFLIQQDDSGVMRMMTQSKKAVVGMQMQQFKDSYLSKGTATGILSEKEDLNKGSNAMSASDFKTQLKNQLRVLKESQAQ